MGGEGEGGGELQRLGRSTAYVSQYGVFYPFRKQPGQTKDDQVIETVTPERASLAEQVHAHG